MLFRVILPGEEGFVSIAFKPDTTMNTVMEQVCKKRMINPDEYLFRWNLEEPGAKNRSESEDIELNKTLGELSVSSVRLIDKRTLLAEE